MTAPNYGSHVANIEWWPLSLGPDDIDADAVEAWAVNAPFDGKLVHFEVNAQAESGTAPTLAIDVQQGTTSLLSAPIAVVTGTPTEAVLAADTSFAKGAKLSIDLDIGGTTPVFSFVSVLIGILRT